MNKVPFQVNLNVNKGGKNREYEFRSTYGIKSAQTVKPEEVLLLKAADLQSTSAVLNVDSRIGVLGCVMSDEVSAGRLMMLESDARSSLVSELNRRKNEAENAKVMISANLNNDLLRKYDVGTFVPKQSDPDHIVRQKIFEISESLRDDSDFYMASDKETINKFKDFVSEFGYAKERVEGDCKVLEVEDLGSPREDGFIQTKLVSHSLKGVRAEFKVLEGFFSAERMNAVEMLGREVKADEGERLLDVSAGFGGAGIFASLLEGVEPVFVNRNAYMEDLVEENCGKNGVEDFDVYTEDGAENFEPASFDIVFYTVMPEDDKKVVYEDLENCRRVLRPGGRVLVCHQRRSDVLKCVQMVFDDVDIKRREIDYQVSAGLK